MDNKKNKIFIIASIAFAVLALPAVLWGFGESNLMKSSSAPHGVLYSLDNHKLRRIDFDKNETDFLFQDLFRYPLQLKHLGYIKKSKRLAFFDCGADVPAASSGCDFLEANPKSKEVQKLFGLNYQLGSFGVSYSPDGKWVAFFGSSEESAKWKPGVQLPPYELRLFDMSSKKYKSLSDDATPPFSPPLWLSDNQLLYVSYSKELIQIDIETKEKNNWGILNIYPWALSAHGNQILATDHEYSKIYLLDSVTKSIKQVKEFDKRQLYGPMVWSPDGESFIYNRTDTRDHLLPQYLWGETPWRLYWHNLETGKEKRISRNPWWKDPWDDIWLYSGAVWFPEDPFDKTV